MNRLDIKRWFKQWANHLRVVAKHPSVVSFGRRYPRLYRFLLLRFDPHHFRGLPLTLLLAGIALNALVLSGVADEIKEVSRLRKADLLLADFFYRHRSQWFGTFLYHFTRIGSSPIVLSLLGILTMASVWRRRFHAWIAICTSLLFSTATAFIGKVYYQLPRPSHLAWYEEFSYSFPSGHATVSVAYYGILFYILLHTVQRPAIRISIRLFAIFFILLIGFSRIYLCVHYLSDVMAGYAIGLLWFLFSVALLSWLDFRKEMRS